ncbi:PIN domain-containing protein [bacterium]|nr:PIN domain-containing protein [bacterium]
MKQIFVDTSAWDAIADAGDANHEMALLYKDEIAENCRLVVTNYILDELHTLMLMNQGYQDTVDFKHQLDTMIQAGILEVVWVTEDIAAETWAVFEKYNVDKEWSFTDCVSYVVMKQREITDVFTFDHHFAQMGFVKQP